MSSEAMETDVPLPDYNVPAKTFATSTLDPWEYNTWLRSIERKMLASDEDAMTDHSSYITELCQACSAMSSVMALRPVQWHIYLSLAILNGTYSGHDLAVLHERSTHDSLDMSLFVRCASFWICAWTRHSGIKVPLQNLGTTYDEHGHASQVSKILPTWTGLTGPTLYDNGIYDVDAHDIQWDISEDDARNALRELYGRCAWHTIESQVMWNMYVAFEYALLEKDPSDLRVDLVKQVYTARLQVPHKQLETTFQRFSSFVSTHLPASEYESVMTSANKLYSDALRQWREREAYDESISNANSTLQAHWSPFLSWQVHRIKQLRTSKDKTHLATEEELGLTLYRRALHRFGMYPAARNDTEASEYADVPPTPSVEKVHKQRHGRKSHKMQERDQAQARIEARPSIAAAESIWLDMIAMVNTPQVEAASLLPICEQATRVLPVCGRLWAVYLRSLTRFHRPKSQVLEIFDLVMKSDCVGRIAGGTSLLALLQARIDCERTYAVLELASSQNIAPEQVVLVADVDRFMHIYELLLQSISAMSKLPEPEQDASLALETYAIDWIERAARTLAASAGADAAAGLNPLADELWTHTLQLHSTHAQAYVQAGQYYQRHDDDKRARQIFKSGVAKAQLDDKAAVLSAWVAFEHARGSPAEIEHAEAKAKVEHDRMWRQWYSYQAQQASTSCVTSNTNAAVVAAAADADADERASLPETDVLKRKADDNKEGDCNDVIASEVESASLAKRQETQHTQPARDREFSSVMVSGLPPNTTEAEVRTFFRDCGIIFDMVGPKQIATTSSDTQPMSAVLVEFTDREGASAARTRDMKRIGENEVRVSLSYACTLYVTNFPPDTSDLMVRERFQKYGPIFDIRWPSRRFVQSRRFCYIQYMIESSAHAALAEHGVHWQPHHALQVYLSNPMLKKQRSDANANDKELYMTGLPRSATVEQVRQFFEPHAPIDDVRMPLRPDGKSRGIAFIQCRTPLDARRAMQATNSTKFHNRLVAVTLADAGRQMRSKDTLHASNDAWRAKSIHVAGLPPDAQEPLIQQAVEAAVGPRTVRQVFWTPGRPPNAHGTCDSIVEMADEEVAGRAALVADAFYGTLPLTFTMYQNLPPSSSAAGSVTPAYSVARRGNHGRGPRGAFEFSRVHNPENQPDTATPKGQDAFRQMLHER